MQLPIYEELGQWLRKPRLELAGLVFLADIKSIARRTAITGSASWLDILFLAPGIHTQQQASELNGGEYPATAALTTGYVFRVENQATARWLQTIGKPGHLTNVIVEPIPSSESMYKNFAPMHFTGTISSFTYLLGPITTLIIIRDLASKGHWWALRVLLLLIFARFLNVLIIRWRNVPGWKGASEPGVHGDLLVLVSQDKWIRIRGLVDDLKAVTSGQWLRDKSGIDEFNATCATVIVYLAAALAINASTEGRLSLLFLPIFSVMLLEWSNATATNFQMHGRALKVGGTPIAYVRRLDLVKQLIEETGRDDWAIGLGMISKSLEEGGKAAFL